MGTVESFEPFDPLEAKTTADTEVRLKALKNEIKGILTSYVGWYDPFCETIQNSMDAVEKRAIKEDDSYQPQIWITIDLSKNSLSVTDNGTGLDEDQFRSFLAPFFSFKNSKNRGHKGVGATYLAYGFNYIQLCTRTSNFSAIGKMLDAKDWVEDDSPSGRPQVINDFDGAYDSHFRDNDDIGASITLKFDNRTFPGNLSWVGMSDASSWLKVLRLKTALGSVHPNPRIRVTLKVIANY